jgi:hypothetical protein
MVQLSARGRYDPDFRVGPFHKIQVMGFSRCGSASSGIVTLALFVRHSTLARCGTGVVEPVNRAHYLPSLRDPPATLALIVVLFQLDLFGKRTSARSPPHILLFLGIRTRPRSKRSSRQGVQGRVGLYPQRRRLNWSVEMSLRRVRDGRVGRSKDGPLRRGLLVAAYVIQR